MRIKDGDWILIEWDPATGRQCWYRDNPDGTTTVRHDYPVDPLIEANAVTRNMAEQGWKGDYHLIASIPANIVQEQLQGALLQKDDRYLSKWLNDADNRAWRTKEGRV